MILLPSHLYRQYLLFCTGKGINGNEFADYLKWLCYFSTSVDTIHLSPLNISKNSSKLAMLRELSIYSEL
jgi:hypothetical protein